MHSVNPTPLEDYYIGGTGVIGRIILKKNDCLRVETEFILLRIWTSDRFLCSTKEYWVSQNSGLFLRM
jgi:hypothetical protein